MPPMRAQRETILVEDSRFLAHRGPDGHPERPERLSAVGRAVAAHGDPIVRVAPRPASPEELLLVHGRPHLERLESLAGSAAQIDPDTYSSPQSFEVACLAAGGSVELVERVARGAVATGLAAVRPPGHHAEADRAMGFCLFNNVAVATRAVQRSLGVERVLILDWDVHHGNGTQHIFEADPTVLYASLHQFPFYPGTGSVAEVGVGPGEGTTLNIPLPAGCGDSEYIGALQKLCVPAAQAFRPEVILISCGFDAHEDDPLAAMQVTQAGYRGMSSIVRTLADDLCDGRIAFILEGGYSLDGLQEGVTALLEAIVGPDPTPYPSEMPLERGSRLETVFERVSEAHGADFSALRGI
jgi:acetoin utilization deacetylase AcuC-like enzyme